MSNLCFLSSGLSAKSRVFPKLCQQCSLEKGRSVILFRSSRGTFTGIRLLNPPSRRSFFERTGSRTSSLVLLSSHLDHSSFTAFQNVLPPDLSFLLGNRFATQLQTLVAEATDQVTSATTEVAKNPGLFDSFVNAIQTSVTMFHGYLEGAGLPYAWGFSIILFTILVKLVTFPLNYKQMESTLSMQALQPKVKELQALYKDNPQLLNMETAKLYKESNINPLAGCLPVLVQIPVWIALYRALLNLASTDQIHEGFFFVPSLDGPVSRVGQGLDTWLFPFRDGAPPIGWHDAICYLILPTILVVSQFISQSILSPSSSSKSGQEDDPQNRANGILKFLPFLVGWFSLNVSSGLTLYWVTNNIVSTLQTLLIRSKYTPAGQKYAEVLSQGKTKNEKRQETGKSSKVVGFGSSNAGGQNPTQKKNKVPSSISSNGVGKDTYVDENTDSSTKMSSKKIK
ncbi:Inner membrane ALBINO3-like protein 2, chloroplastic [Galdieria sulphuraria]|uniref:Preprotein translocase, Oxa1 family n=1 Tax=Galdieria sulphuraria TaxID=130081 RepID=M2W1T6_GALSU|nr:preprotein translocase, Oxa1 family [Galdieria sulphuraria]EME29641.1 preprotein translocase, Oxa1 family [Galdieria sulphuraria]GJD12763.1 Inner membrane ALBINO3-like protein 2, chloroplastic [Galdieria sulphuraria]|eukprot:XP_005706161.1 preprotein translocase, Oxa1 family [Galdieria sulphuraria]